MRAALEGYKTVLSHLLIGSAVEFHKENVEQIEPLAGNVTGLGAAFGAYKINVNALLEEYAQRLKSIETDLMVLKDEKRDATSKYYLATIDYLSKYPQNEAEAEAIYKLKFIADTYRNAPRKDYTAETSALRSLIRDTRKLVAEVALFDLAKILNRLELENNDFEALHITRTSALEEKRERGALKVYAIKANESFDAMAQIINGLYLMKELDPQSKPSLLQIIRILKGLIHAYTIIWHHHSGTTSSKKKDDGDGSDEGDGDGSDGGDDGEGGDGGDGDGGDFQEPDIENPPPFGE